MKLTQNIKSVLVVKRSYIEQFQVYHKLKIKETRKFVKKYGVLK